MAYQHAVDRLASKRYLALEQARAKTNSGAAAGTQTEAGTRTEAGTEAETASGTVPKASRRTAETSYLLLQWCVLSLRLMLA